MFIRVSGLASDAYAKRRAGGGYVEDEWVFVIGGVGFIGSELVK